MILRSLAASTALFLATSAMAQQEADTSGIDTDNLVQTVRTMASDQFEGRAPGTVGEERTIGYLIGRLQGLGLEPAGEDGTWTQKVPLLHTRLGEPQVLAFEHSGGTSKGGRRDRARRIPPSHRRSGLSHARVR